MSMSLPFSVQLSRLKKKEEKEGLSDDEYKQFSELNKIVMYEKVAGFFFSNFPEVFDHSNPKPLAIGIRKDLYNACNLPNVHIKRFMYYWTNTEKYLWSLIKSSSRYDLNLNKKGVITDEQKELALEKLMNMN